MPNQMLFVIYIWISVLIKETGYSNVSGSASTASVASGNLAKRVYCCLVIVCFQFGFLVVCHEQPPMPERLSHVSEVDNL